MAYIIRTANVKDAADINLMRRMPGVLENICSLPSEPVFVAEKMLEVVDARIHHFVVEFVSEDGAGQVVGYARLAVNEMPRVRHCGGVFLMVHTDHQGAGVGKMLMEALLDIADNWLKLVRVELEVFTENERAIRLYEKMGFEKEGVKCKAAIRLGSYADEFIMARIRE